MHRAVFDSNVYVSALIYGGKPEDLIKRCHGRNKQIELYCSPTILKETADVLSSDKFNWPEPRIIKVIRHIARIANIVEPKSVISVLSDKSDNRILECAQESKADFIVSGDSHLLNLKEYENISILKPAQFLELLQKEK